MLRRRATDARRGDIFAGEDCADVCPASLRSSLTGESDTDLSVRISILRGQLCHLSSVLLDLACTGCHGARADRPTCAISQLVGSVSSAHSNRRSTERHAAKLC